MNRRQDTMSHLLNLDRRNLRVANCASWAGLPQSLSSRPSSQSRVPSQIWSSVKQFLCRHGKKPAVTLHCLQVIDIVSISVSVLEMLTIVPG